MDLFHLNPSNTS